MKQYRKKPVTIEAVQFDGLNPTEIKDFVGENCEVEIYDNEVTPPVARIVIHTLEGDMEVSKGDYVIKGVKGEFYPCKPDIFERTYESEKPDKILGEAAEEYIKKERFRIMTEKNLKLTGDGAEMTLIDGELSNFEKALEEIMKDAMGLVGDYISPLYIKERAEYLRKQMIKEIEDEGNAYSISDVEIVKVQQEVDLEKVVMIDNLIMNLAAEGYNDGYKTRPFYEEVLRRFNAKKQ